jgi:hypothetical protein
MADSGVRRCRGGGHECWVKSCDDSEVKHIIATGKNCELIAVIEHLSACIMCAVRWNHVPSGLYAEILSRIAPESLDRLQEIGNVNLDYGYLYKLERADRDRRIEAEVEDRLRAISRHTANAIQIRPDPKAPPYWSDAYPPIPPLRLPATCDGDGLPESSGVYFVRDEYGDIVYVGQSINLSKRATLSHPNIFDGEWVGYLEFPAATLLYAESFYIGVSRPPRNFGAFQSRLAEREELEAVGL